MNRNAIEVGVDYDPDTRRCNVALRDTETRQGVTLSVSQPSAAGLTALLYFASTTKEDWSSGIKLAGGLEVIGHD